MHEIARIHREYFELINSFFGSIKHHLGEGEDSHIDLGFDIANYPFISDLIIDAVDDLGDEIAEFWRRNAETAINSCGQQPTLKCVYSGDITPIILEDFVKKAALYLDTVVIADPILNLAWMQKQYIDDKKYYLNKLVRHVFNVYRLKDLLTSDSDECVLSILPMTFQILNSNERQSLFEKANLDFIAYFNSLFSKNITSVDGCFEFAANMSNCQQIFENVKNIEILPNKFKSKEGLSEFITNFNKPKGTFAIKGKGAGWDFCLYIQSQFIRVKEHAYFCEKINAEPIYDYELPWFFFNYQMGGLDMDAAIANSLQQEKFKWVTKVPLRALQIFREENKLEYMRSILRTGLHDLKTKTDDISLSRTCEQIETNLNDAFKRQEAEIQGLEAEVAKIVKKEIPITTGGCLVGLIPVYGNIISFLSAGRDIKNLINKRKMIKKEIEVKKASFINLLLKSYK